ncbi:DUF3696 domain-containing protein [Bacillus cereus group sp. TH150LC]|uniref:DUF3696 domain-containing protein n=1 Tax=Bacillus cereus group sp. TH150LC TaxID=3018061 RepID=UPI0022E53DAA|nr:DUF3696 domain-containing protein [Bacillus cereus group sp. TH150LC]MDA1658163.1 DUF3696 domain-containing protein [Bacillus cereus group sp. TH150LC]HDR4513821.1 DUF3696 domain-containing protein [Bacillus cereus]
MISKLNIQNYKCWVDQEVHFSPLTILAGGNAVGKSSIVQSLLLMKKAYENVYNGEILSSDVNGINLGLPKDIISKEKTSEQIILKNTLDNGNSNEVRLTIGDEIINPLSFLIENKEDLLEKKYDPFNNFQYLNAERIGPRITSDISSNSILDVGNKGEYTNHIINKADLLKHEIHESMRSSRLARFSANCESWLDIIIPGTQLNVSLHEEVNKVTIKFKNTKTSSDAYVPTATGFGLTYVLPIIVSGLLFSTYKDSLLIIENPEAHLHPYGQSKIGQFLAMLASCGVQVIVETHSEHVINGARLQLAKMKQTDKMIVNFFNIVDDRINIEKIEVNTYGELEKWPKGFFDQNKADLRELLRLRL